MCQYKNEACSLKFLQIYVHMHIGHTGQVFYYNNIFWKCTSRYSLCHATTTFPLYLCTKTFSVLANTKLLFIKVNECVLLSYHVRISKGIYTLQLPECQGTPCSKQFKRQQQDSNRSGCGFEYRCCHIKVNLSCVYYLS